MERGAEAMGTVGTLKKKRAAISKEYEIAKAIVRKVKEATDVYGEDDGGAAVWEAVNDDRAIKEQHAEAEASMLETAEEDAANDGEDDEVVSEAAWISKQRKRMNVVYGCAEAVENLMGKLPEDSDHLIDLASEAESVNDIDKAERLALGQIDTAIAVRTLVDAYLRTVPSDDRDEAEERVQVLAFEDES